jgi:ribosomal protein S18 acetylase RimI-like enzyme
MNATIAFCDAVPEDAMEVVALHNAVALALTARYGAGHWSAQRKTSATLDLRHARVRLGRIDGRIVSALRLATKKPWAIDVAYFTPVKRALYLTGMAVSPQHQGRGIGRMALDDARVTAQAWPAEAIRLDAYDAAAGAGEFYARSGFRECGRVVYRGSPLIYFELLVTNEART